MERFNFFCYNMGHETPWIPRGTGEAPSRRHFVVERRQGQSFGHSAFGGGIKKLSLPMVSTVPRRRIGGPSLEGHSRTSSEAVSNREREVSGTAFGGSSGRRISDRSVDIEADRSNHSETLSYPVSPQSCVAVASGHGMELSETRASGVTKGRQRDRTLEGSPVAAYKKTPKDLGPSWSFLMSLASYSFQTFAAPGLQKGKPLSSTTCTNRIGFPLSVLCRSPRNESGWPFISDFGHGTSPVWMFGLFLKNCSNISGDPCSCCGIEPPSTGERKLNSFFFGTLEFIWNTFRPMLPSLIRLSMFGTRLTVPCPTVYRKV